MCPACVHRLRHALIKARRKLYKYSYRNILHWTRVQIYADKALRYGSFIGQEKSFLKNMLLDFFLYLIYLLDVHSTIQVYKCRIVSRLIENILDNLVFENVREKQTMKAFSENRIVFGGATERFSSQNCVR